MLKNITIETYNTIAKKYHEIFQNDFSEKFYYNKFLKIINGKKILDVGCGTGTYTNYMSKKGFDVLGIDYSEEMLKIAKKEYPNISFKKINMKDIQLNEKFNGIVCANSLFHIQKKDVTKILNKFYELLENHGKILCILLDGQGEGLKKEPLNKKLSTFVNYYTTDNFSKILNESGFHIIYKSIKKTLDGNELGNNKIIIISEKL